MATKNDGVDLSALPPVVRAALLACTPQAQRFVVNYCSHAQGNGQLAVKLSGTRADYGTRCSMASQLLKEPSVRAAVDAWWTTYAVAASEVTARIADLGRASLEPFIRLAQGEPVQPKVKRTKGKKGRRRTTMAVIPRGALVLREQTEDGWARHAHWIKSVEVDPKTGRITRLQVHDALKALDLHAKILKLYSDAPTVNLFHLQGLSDEELLAEYEQAAREAGFGGAPRSTMN